jgi:hypothetical protein
VNQSGAIEKFSKRGPWIISSRGFRVRTLGRAGMEYVEADMSLHVDSEAMATRAFVVYTQSLPTDSRIQIIDNLTRAWRSSGFDIQVQE